MQTLTPFHLAVPVKNLEIARTFYRDILECKEGRSSDTWVDFDFFGHQFVIHENKNLVKEIHHNSVDNHAVPVPHFGVVLEWKQFHDLADKLTKKEVTFSIAPYIRFKGLIGEQATMFFYDPSGNALEFKSFKDVNQVFAK